MSERRTIICSIYENRPQMCKDYPKQGSYIMPQCGYFFPGDGTRRGSCTPECEAACCREPRRNGEPGEGSLPAELGGEPCKYLVVDSEDDDAQHQG